MPSIRANRESINDRFSVLGFTVRSESPLFEVGIATDPSLFRPENRARRTRRNFYSSRAVGAIRAPRGEAVYLVPPEVLGNFVGQRKIYFGLATYRESSGGKPDFVQAPTEGHVYVDMAGLTERGLRRIANPVNGASYGATNGRDPSLEWGGDGAGPNGGAAPVTARSAAEPAPPAPGAAPAPYDDGFGQFPEPTPAPPAEPPSAPPASAAPAPTPAPAAAPGVATAPASASAPAPAPVATSQSIRATSRPLAVRALEIISPFYDPADPATALTCQADAFSRAREEWFAGVPNTTIFPHSAICLLEMKDSSGTVVGYGTGFYIGRNRILTCAHNLRGKASVDVVPACNDTREPYGRFNVTSASWRLPTSYDGSGAYDLAVIDNLPADAPGGRWFDALEELNQSRPEGVVVCGYSRKSDRVPELTAAMNGRTQHLHAGYIAQLRGEVFDYPILTLHRASGSPVYYLSDREGAMKAYVVGVHISGELATTQELNTGCRLTDAKIAWIEGRSTTLGLRAAPAPVPRRATRALEAAAPQAEIKLRVFIPCRAVPAIGLTGRRAFAGDDRGFSYDEGTSRAELVGRVTLGAAGAPPTVSLVSRSFGRSEEYSHDDLVDVAGKPDWYKSLREGATPLAADTLVAGDDNLKIELGAGSSTTESVFSALENTTVVTIGLAGALPLMTGAPAIDATLYLHLKSVGGRLRALVHGSHDGFPAFELYVNRQLVYSYDPVAAGSSPDALLPPEDVTANTSYVDLGSAEAVQALAVAGGPRATARQLAGQSFAVHWDTTPYYPQSTTASCWAASAAMVVGWRDGRTVSDREIADAVPVIDAYRGGLWPRDRQTLADAWDLVAEPPASYTIEAWRDMLQRYGPIYVDMTATTSGQGGHVRVLVGMESNGAADGSDTTMFMHDPWPGSPGRVRVTFADFLALYERRVDNSGGTLEYQLLHAAAVPSHLRPSLAAPFALASAQALEPAAAPGADAAASRYRLAPPPEPLVQQQGLGPRALLAPAVISIASTVVGTVMTRVINNSGDVTWELDQMRGLKHPNNTAPDPLPAAQDGTPIRLTDWPYVENHLNDRISAGFEINWQHNGVSVGNVQISNIATNDAVGWGLDVKAHIMDDDIVYPREAPHFAAVKVRFEYRFTRAIGSDSIAIQDVHLFGNGAHNVSGRWEQ